MLALPMRQFRNISIFTFGTDRGRGGRSFGFRWTRVSRKARWSLHPGVGDLGTGTQESLSRVLSGAVHREKPVG